MGKILVIPGADFSANALPYFIKALVKKGTSISIPIKNYLGVTQDTWVFTADADEDTWTEYNLPNSYPIEDGVSFNYMFRPANNPSAANIKELYIDVRYNVVQGSYAFLDNNGIEKLVLFGNYSGAILTLQSSTIQGLHSLKYLDISKVVNIGTGTFKPGYPIICDKVEIVNLKLNEIYEAPLIDYCCDGAASLIELNMMGWRLASGVTYLNAFRQCNKLEHIYIDDATTAAKLIDILSDEPTAHVDALNTTFDAVNNVINVVHIPY